MNWFKQSPRVYLDIAAASPVRSSALRAFTKATASCGNPSSPHTEGREAKEILEDARIRIARLAEVKSDAVVFTGNATEGNALAIEGHVRAIAAKKNEYAKMHVLYLPSAHASTIGAIRRIESYGVAVEAIELAGATIDLVAFAKQLRPETVLVCVDAVCSETGVRFDTRGVRRAIESVAAHANAGTDVHRTHDRAMLHVDASQLPLTESFERMRIGADTFTLDAQKVGGVRGIGALIAPSHVSLLPLIEGGGQERGLRSGTESPALASAFATALEEAQSEKESFTKSASELRRFLSERIKRIPNTFFNEGATQTPHILNISLVGRDTDYLVALLDEAGFAVSTKSACETDASGSRAVLAFTGEQARAASTLRISWGNTTTRKDVERFATALTRAVSFLDTSS